MRRFLFAVLLAAPGLAWSQPCAPSSATGLNYISYPVGPDATETTVTAGTPSHTKGAYVEFASSTPFAANGLLVTVLSAGTSGASYLLDIATGGSGSETVVVPNLMVDRISSGTSHTGNGQYWIPLAIASGTRLSARVQSTTASSTVTVAMTLFAAGSCASPSSYTTEGVDTGTSLGTQVDPGGSAGTKGAYAEIVASTSSVAQGLLITFSTRGNTAPTNGRWAVDIATGGAGSEVVLIPDLRIFAATGVAVYPRSVFVYAYIPAGTRIAARASSSITDATDRIFNISVTHAPMTPPAGGGGSEHSAVH